MLRIIRPKNFFFRINEMTPTLRQVDICWRVQLFAINESVLMKVANIRKRHSMPTTMVTCPLIKWTVFRRNHQHHFNWNKRVCIELVRRRIRFLDISTCLPFNVRYIFIHLFFFVRVRYIQLNWIASCKDCLHNASSRLCAYFHWINLETEPLLVLFFYF